MMLAWLTCFLLYVWVLFIYLLVTVFLYIASASNVHSFIPGPYYYDDLEDMMFDSISESFSADFEDGSVEEVIIVLSIMFSLAGPKLGRTTEYLIKYLLV